MDLFPIFLKLTGRRCLVVGAGNLAESKIESLRAAHAAVTVIAPWASPRIAELAAAGEVKWHQRGYEPGDVAPDTFLVVTATNVGEVNRAVYLEAQEKNILCNAATSRLPSRPPVPALRSPSGCARRSTRNFRSIPATGSPILAICAARSHLRSH
jgi:siroheme synthase-like protein